MERRSRGPSIPLHDDIIALIATEILPHESDVRGWLRKARYSGVDADDLIQEAYCRIFSAAKSTTITDGRAYFFTVTRNLAYEALRRSQVVAMERANILEAQDCSADDPSPEQVVIARQTLGTVQAVIRDLPERCRDVFVLRRLKGLPQREIAERLGISENVVEKEVAKGLRSILQALAVERSGGSVSTPHPHGMVHTRNDARKNHR